MDTYIFVFDFFSMLVSDSFTYTKLNMTLLALVQC